MAAVQLANTPLINDPNLKGYWELENANFTTVGANLNNAGGATFTAAVFNNGVNGGTSNSTKYLYNDTFEPIAYADRYNWTLTCWVKVLTAQFGVISQCGVTDGSSRSIFGLRIFDATHFDAQFFPDASPVTLSVKSTTTYTVGTFYFLAATFDGSVMKIYVNGVLDNSGNSSGGNTSSGSFQGFGILDQRINNADGSQWASAVIDDLAWFNRVLAAQEINNLFTGNFSSIVSVSGVPQANIANVSGVTNANLKSVSGVVNQ